MTNQAECSHVYGDLTHPTTTVYIALFLLVGLLAIFGNVLALSIFLKPEMRSRSNSILVSLALSDTLVGCVLCPLTVYQLIDIKALTNCAQENTRVYLSVSLIGTSAINVGYIAYDRYILLTRLNIKSSRHSRTIAFLVTSWIIPSACLSLNFVSIYPSIVMLCLIIFGPLSALAIFYCLISKEISEKEKQLFKCTDERKEDQLQERATATMHKHMKQRNLRLAKQVTFLVVFYIICLIPSAIAVVINMLYIVTNKVKPVSLQNFFLFSLLAASSNSCINPIIYASKYPEVRKCLRQMLKQHKSRNLTSELNITHESTV